MATTPIYIWQIFRHVIQECKIMTFWITAIGHQAQILSDHWFELIKIFCNFPRAIWIKLKIGGNRTDPSLPSLPPQLEFIANPSTHFCPLHISNALANVNLAEAPKTDPRNSDRKCLCQNHHTPLNCHCQNHHTPLNCHWQNHHSPLNCHCQNHHSLKLSVRITTPLNCKSESPHSLKLSLSESPTKRLIFLWFAMSECRKQVAVIIPYMVRPTHFRIMRVTWGPPPRIHLDRCIAPRITTILILQFFSHS